MKRQTRKQGRSAAEARPPCAGEPSAPRKTAPARLREPDEIRPAASIAVFIAALALYLPTVRFGFVEFWDDDINILDNPYLHPMTAWKFGHLWTHSYSELFVPLLYSAFGLEYWLGAGKPWIFHLMNALLHAGVCVFVYLILVRLVRQMWPCVLGVLVFAVHPIQTEAVTWVTGQKDLLSAVLAFAALWLYLRWRETGPRVWYGAAIAVFILSLLSKPAVVVLPVIMFSIDLYLGIGWRSSVRALFLWVVISAGWTLGTSRIQETHVAFPLWLRAFAAGDALLFYLRKIAWPSGLAAAYGRSPWDLTRETGWWLGLPLCCAGLICMLWLHRQASRHRGAVWFSAAIFVAGVLPVLGLKAFRYQNESTVADRYVYMSMLAPAFAVAYAASILATRRRRVVVFMSLVLVVLAALTLRQQRYWINSEALVARSLAFMPHDRIERSIVSLYYLDKRNRDEVISEFEKLAATKKHPYVYQNLGILLSRKPGREKDALQAYRNALEIEPSLTAAHHGIGSILLRQGDIDGAIEEFREALLLAPYRTVIHLNYARALEQAGRWNEAIEPLDFVVRMKPGAEAWAELAAAYMKSGKRGDAWRAATTALDLDRQTTIALQVMEDLGSIVP